MTEVSLPGQPVAWTALPMCKSSKVSVEMADLFGTLVFSMPSDSICAS